MKSARVSGAIVTAVLVMSASRARADRDEASLHVQPTGGVAWLGETDADARARVPWAGLSGRFTYGLRNWLAIECELGGAAFGTGRFENVPIVIQGVGQGNHPIERTTRAAHLSGAATLRLGVAWIPTLALGVGGQLRWRGDAHTDMALVPDNGSGGLGADGIVFVRVGLDRRINRRWIAGVALGASHALAKPAIDSMEATVSVAYYWYPLW